MVVIDRLYFADQTVTVLCPKAMPDFGDKRDALFRLQSNVSTRTERNINTIRGDDEFGIVVNAAVRI